MGLISVLLSASARCQVHQFATEFTSLRLGTGGPSQIFLSQNEYVNIIKAWGAASSSGPPENKSLGGWNCWHGILSCLSTPGGYSEIKCAKSLPVYSRNSSSQSSSRSPRGQTADPYKLL